MIDKCSPPEAVAAYLSRSAPPALAHPPLSFLRRHSSLLAMPPRCRYYTIQLRLFLLEKVRIHREARLPLEPEKDFEEEVPGEEEEKEEQEPVEEEQEPVEEEEEAPPLDVEKEAVSMMEEDVSVWLKQHAILNSICSESVAEARRHRRQ